MRLFDYGMIFRRLVCTVFIVFFTYSMAKSSPLEIKITEGKIKSTSIAITPFYASVASGQDRKNIANIRKVIESDLAGSGLFKAVDSKVFIQKPSQMRFKPSFADWLLLNTEILVTGNYTKQIDGKIVVEFFIWDTLSQRQMFAKKYAVAERSWRRISHIIADDIYRRITGETGYFDSRLLYVATDKVGKRIRKRLIIMDSDGANEKIITAGRYFVLTPRFSPDNKMIAYLSYKRGMPSIYLNNIETGEVTYISQFKHMTYAPRFSPDSRKIIFAYASNGKSNIWTMDLQTNVLKQITNNRFIDTSPSYAPDGNSIVFTSNRSGSLQLYVLNLKNGHIRRLSSGKGSYTTPVWSPRGDKIAFTKQLAGRFYIGVLSIDGSGERLLSSSFLEEGPTFSPNGRVVMFSRNTGIGTKKQLVSIDIMGYNERVLPTPYSATDPSWSALNVK